MMDRSVSGPAQIDETALRARRRDAATSRVPRPPLRALMVAVLAVWGAVRAAAPDEDAVLARARAAIIARVGESVFDSCVDSLSVTNHAPGEYCATLNECPEMMRKGYSEVRFRFRVPGVPFVDATLGCIVDSDGVVSGLAAPKCAADPRECWFPYDATAAQELARRAGLEPGLGPWVVSFHWHHGFETFVWVISNTLDRAKGTADGESVLIDANDGRVLGHDHWTEQS